ncbi:P-loop containing nucleoside triphosphate hydrolase protein [Immersiella caudata]|uniref:P-loop containing nucleoside triphosphate hydrolase protein n=1 Tax=Immersiella caudata TaxID=314043 RepID=A0AA40C707_9PEZI|nr:P-loop containing nucleoside triphosphate hydrolase protein [Immersiella caudata]
MDGTDSSTSGERPPGAARDAKRKQGTKTTIAVLGVTGAGKSTFINVAFGLDTLEVSHGSKPCTQDPQPVEFRIGNRTVVLIDTPGFDDDKRDDVRILEDIATWMARKGYLEERKLDGLIFLHPVTHTRAGRSELNRTQLLEKILGPDAYNRVFIATTMWGYIANEDLVQERLNSRFARGGVWHELISNGAQYVKHDNTQRSAHEIIRRIMAISDTRGKPKTLLENELKSKEGRLGHTTAGRELERQIKGKIKEAENLITAHMENKPPVAFKHSKVSDERKAWKRWHNDMRDMQTQLSLERQRLDKLQNIVVRLIKILASWFRSSSR